MIDDIQMSKLLDKVGVILSTQLEYLKNIEYREATKEYKDGKAWFKCMILANGVPVFVQEYTSETGDLEDAKNISQEALFSEIFSFSLYYGITTQKKINTQVKLMGEHNL